MNMRFLKLRYVVKLFQMHWEFFWILSLLMIRGLFCLHLGELCRSKQYDTSQYQQRIDCVLALNMRFELTSNVLKSTLINWIFSCYRPEGLPNARYSCCARSASTWNSRVRHNACSLLSFSLFADIIPSIFARLLVNAGTIILLGTIAVLMSRMGFSADLLPRLNFIYRGLSLRKGCIETQVTLSICTNAGKVPIFRRDLVRIPKLLP